MKKNWKMTETLAYGYSSESTQWELPDEYQHDEMILDDFRKILRPCALDERSLSIGLLGQQGGYLNFLTIHTAQLVHNIQA